MLPSISPRWLLLFPLAWLACSGGRAASSTTGTSSAASSASSSGTGGAGTSSAASSASSSGTGGVGTSSASSSGTGGAGGGATTASGTGGGTGGTGGMGGASSSAAASSSSASGTGGGPTGTRVRVVAANLSSGTQQSYDPGEGIRILEGVHGDVVLMQETNYGANNATDLRALMDAVCGAACVFMRGTGQIPNAVVSRYPIVASGTWTDPQVSNRDFTWARIDVPGPTDLWAVSVHLLTTATTARDMEAAALVALLQANVPASDFVVVGGDFNTAMRSEPAITTLQARLSTAAPYPVDGNGNGNTSAPRTRPYDWVLPSPELRAHETPVVIGAAHFDNGLVVDTRIYTPIADLAPALVGDSGATGMQHMAVVRDFLLE